MDDNAALELLEVLLPTGKLKIITANEDPEGIEYGDRDPRFFVRHVVTRLEGPDMNGRYRAWSGEGDWCVGKPVALYKRLTESMNVGG